MCVMQLPGTTLLLRVAIGSRGVMDDAPMLQVYLSCRLVEVSRGTLGVS